jgi:ribonuclease HI
MSTLPAFYAVAVGRVPGVYRSWPETKKQVDGFKNPKYRKFATQEEADDFVTNGAKAPSVLAQFGVTAPIDIPTKKPIAPLVIGDTDLAVFTDGSAIANGRKNARAGYAMVWPNHPEYTAGKPLVDSLKTNNRAEFMACIDALTTADTIDPGRTQTLYIFTDSMLLINTVTKWRQGWKRNGWKKASGEPIMNRDLVERLDTLLNGSPRQVVWRHVEAHTNKTDWQSIWNAKADELAKSAVA